MKAYPFVYMAMTIAALSPLSVWAKSVPKTRAPATSGDEPNDADATGGKQSPDKVNCHVTVTTIRKNGETSERHFYSFTSDKDGCARDAELHHINFAPQAVLEKKVTFEWREH